MKTNIVKYLLLFLVFFCFTQAVSADIHEPPADDSHILTIEKYVQMALDYDPNLKICQLKLEQAVADIKTSKASFMPKINASTGVNYAYDAKNPSRDNYSTNFNISAKYNIYSAGENPKKYEKSAISLQKAESNLNIAQEQIIYKSIKMFNDMLNLQMNVSIRRNEEVYYQNLLLLARKRDLKGQEYLRASVLLTQSEQKLLTAIQNFDAGKEDFAYLIGKEPSPELKLDTTLAFHERLFSIDKCLKLAFSRRTDFLQLESAIEKQKKIIIYTKKKGTPTLDFSAGYGWFPSPTEMNNAFKQFYLDRPRINGGLSASIPIYDGGERANNIKIEETALDILEQEKENLRRDITREVRQALSNFESAKSRYILAGDTVTKTTQNLNSIFDNYAESQANLEQVDQVIGTVTNAGISKSQAIIDYYNSLADLNKATGSMFEYYETTIIINK